MGRQAEDLTNRRFGMLTVTERIMINNRTHWKCKCDCGGEKITSATFLKKGCVKTCGCRRTFKENVRKALEEHCVDGTYKPTITNKALNKNNTSGYKGVGYRKDRNKYRAYIKYQKKNIFLGHYDNIEDAIKARKLAEEKFFGKYNKE